VGAAKVEKEQEAVWAAWSADEYASRVMMMAERERDWSIRSSIFVGCDLCDSWGKAAPGFFV
jgi:hypothetical protein